MMKFISLSRKFFTRKFSSKAASKVTASETVLNDIEAVAYKPRNHPGIIKSTCTQLPKEFVEAAEMVIKDYPIKLLVTNSVQFAQHLHHRVPPMEHEEKNDLQQKLLLNIIKKGGNIELNSEQDEEQFKQKANDKLQNLMKKKVYNWKPIDYNYYNSLLYMYARSAPEYAVLTKIFLEINKRDQDFKPKSLFDFGSGIGTATWAATAFWKKHIFEYFNVDASSNMNDLAEILLKGGSGTGVMKLKGVFYRQFLPANNVTYDLVVCAYSLMELSSFALRIQTILKLWNKTEKYLVIVEHGTNAGFKVVNEIRDYILKKRDENNDFHVFSPCPHEEMCPRFLSEDNTPCNFEVTYQSLPLGIRLDVKKELYSYLVLKRGSRDEEDSHWPRVVRQPLVRARHTVCRMCTANGKLQEVIFTASKHGKTLYHCARSTKWGDRLPIKLEDQSEE